MCIIYPQGENPTPTGRGGIVVAISRTEKYTPNKNFSKINFVR